MKEGGEEVAPPPPGKEEVEEVEEVGEELGDVDDRARLLIESLIVGSGSRLSSVRQFEQVSDPGPHGRARCCWWRTDRIVFKPA